MRSDKNVFFSAPCERHTVWPVSALEREQNSFIQAPRHGEGIKLPFAHICLGIIGSYL